MPVGIVAIGHRPDCRRVRSAGMSSVAVMTWLCRRQRLRPFLVCRCRGGGMFKFSSGTTAYQQQCDPFVYRQRRTLD